MKPFLTALTLGLLFVLLSGCELLGLGSPPLDLQLKASPTVIYSLQTFTITAEVPSELSGKVRFKWYEGNSSTAFRDDTWNGVAMARYVTKPTDLVFRVEASYQGKTVESTVTVTVSPYLGSDASTIILANHLGRTISEVFVYLSQPAYTPINSPLLNGNLLTNGSTVTFANLVPGWYMIGGVSVGGQSNGAFGTQINAGDNYVELN